MTCPVQGCDYPAGTACTMAGCPGTSLRPRSLTGVRKGPDNPLPVRPHLVSLDTHTPAISQVQQ
jgi:hypothetical protein